MFFGDSMKVDPFHSKFVLNLLLFLAKFYIHKCKFSKKTPSFFIFKKDIDMYLNSLKDSKNSTACKTLHYCRSFKLV